MFNLTKKQLVNKIKSVLSVASEVSEILVHVKSNPTKLDLASLGFKTLNSYLIHFHSDLFENPFTSDNWIFFDLKGFSPYIVKLLMSNCPVKVVCSSGDNEAYVYATVNVHGIDIGLYYSKVDDYYEALYLPLNKRNESLSNLQRFLWDTHNSNFLLLSHKEVGSEIHFSFVGKNIKNVLSSEAAEDLYVRSKKFLDNGFNRSIMLHGNPGVGKSAALLYVANKFNMRTLKLSISDVDTLDPSNINMLVELLNPSVLIIDDFDRISSPEKFLLSLESINENIKLFFVTINNKEALNRAILRPGRFDDIIEFNKLDDHVYDSLIGDAPQHIKERVKRLPVAYINDFHKRKKVFGLDQAVDELESLEKRICEISQIKKDEDDEDDDE